MTTALLHEAIRKPRQGHYEEAVYDRHWKKLMADLPTDPWGHLEIDKTMLDVVLHQHPWKPDQRAAEIAATFIVWLGCNNGREILTRAASFRAVAVRRPMLMAWYENNVREWAVNGGYRTIEAMLAPDDCLWKEGESRLGPGDWVGSLKRLPTISAEEYEVIEHVCDWLDTGAGQLFVKRVEAEIEKGRDDFYRAKSAPEAQPPESIA